MVIGIENQHLEFKQQLTDKLDFEKEIVEQMGLGIHRILQAYPKSIYPFSQNFIRVVLPFAEGFVESQTDTPEVTMQADEHEQKL